MTDKAPEPDAIPKADPSMFSDCGDTPCPQPVMADPQSMRQKHPRIARGILDLLYGNNVFDNQYVKGLNTYGRGPLGVVGATISEPRTYGMEVAVKF